MINEIIEAINELEEENSSIFVCVLVCRGEPLEKWDILVSADFLEPRIMESYDIIAKKLRKFINEKEYSKIGHIEILKKDDATVKFLRGLGNNFDKNPMELSRLFLLDYFNFYIEGALLLKKGK